MNKNPIEKCANNMNNLQKEYEKIFKFTHNRNANWNNTENISHSPDWQTYKLYDTFFWQGCMELGTLVHCWWEEKISHKTVHLLFDSAIPLLRIYPEDKPPTTQKYICISLFIEAFVIIASYLKLLKCPRIETRCINYSIYTHCSIMQL